MVRGNRGEWSEFYTFLKLLDEKRLDAADENLEKLQDIFYPVLKITREESITNIKTYEFAESNKVRILQSGSEIALVDSSDLKAKVRSLLTSINASTDTTFEIPAADELMDRFRAKKLGAGSSKKEDIILKIHDRMTGTEPEVGFSIKSMLGAASTLLNASTATSFIYKISGLPKDKVDSVNSIETRSKIRDRLAAIGEYGGSFSYAGITSDVFAKNLRKIDTILPEIVAQLLLAFYLGKGYAMPELISHLGDEEMKILNFDMSHSDYEFKIKSLLQNVALGMVPDTAWDGLLRAHGGYIVVRSDGEIVCYHVYNADAFRSYLYKNTRFDTPSTTRHQFGSVYEENGELYIKLTLQIRFTR